MRPVLLLLLLAGCATAPHADVFVKKNFGFAGQRELTLVGPREDTQALRLLLQRQGFAVLEVSELEQAKTKYVASVGGVCHNPLTFAPPDADLHVYVMKAETQERVLSVRLQNDSECPDAFFAEAVVAIARHWPDVAVE